MQLEIPQTKGDRSLSTSKQDIRRSLPDLDKNSERAYSSRMNHRSHQQIETIDIPGLSRWRDSKNEAGDTPGLQSNLSKKSHRRATLDLKNEKSQFLEPPIVDTLVLKTPQFKNLEDKIQDEAWKKSVIIEDDRISR